MTNPYKTPVIPPEEEPDQVWNIIKCSLLPPLVVIFVVCFPIFIFVETIFNKDIRMSFWPVLDLGWSILMTICMIKLFCLFVL